jgi:hypothetical protein
MTLWVQFIMQAYDYDSRIFPPFEISEQVFKY